MKSHFDQSVILMTVKKGKKIDFKCSPGYAMLFLNELTFNIAHTL